MAALFLLGAPLLGANANENQVEKRRAQVSAIKDYCILGWVEKSANDDSFLDGRGVTRNCSCYANQFTQGLDTSTCHNSDPITRVSGENIRQLLEMYGQ